MPNMSYCRFENTARDLADCADNIADPLSESEHEARKRLLRQCVRVLRSIGIEVDDEDLKEAIEETNEWQ